MGGPPYHEAMMRGRVMDEKTWLESSDPQAMLEWVRLGNVAADDDYPPSYPSFPRKTSDRRLRLFACACCRLRGMVSDTETANRYEESLEGLGLTAAQWASNWCHPHISTVSKIARADLLRHIIGNPFRPALSVPCGVCRSTGIVAVDGESDTRWADRRKTAKIYPKCLNCSGRGYLLIEPPREVCPHCNGKGRHQTLETFSTERDCGNCNGSGRITRWPAPIPLLAEALDAGNQDAAPLLCDALLELGGEAGAVLAEHFRPRRKCDGCEGKGTERYCDAAGDMDDRDCSDCHGTGWLGEEWHPKGCAWLDAVLFRE